MCATCRSDNYRAGAEDFQLGPRTTVQCEVLRNNQVRSLASFLSVAKLRPVSPWSMQGISILIPCKGRSDQMRHRYAKELQQRRCNPKLTY